MTEPLHIAFVWHMHQPYYRFGRRGPFEMPWARLHGLKDYLDMVEVLRDFPDLHQTFNLVPSLVEQLEAYASGDFRDLYWDHTLKPADELSPEERVFLVDLMCERSDHPRARAHPRYLELALKKEALLPGGLDACARAFTADDLRDLQIWFNLAWFDPRDLETGPLADLLRRGRDFVEEDKAVVAGVQADLLARIIPAYRNAASRGQVELSTTPFFHPILPLLLNSDSARLSAGDTILPCMRFSHPEDAAEHVRLAMAKHERVFGNPPVGMWCSEQAVGEDVLPLLLDAGITWTISDESVLTRSLAGAELPFFEPVTGLGPGPQLPLHMPDGTAAAFPVEDAQYQRRAGEASGLRGGDHTLGACYAPYRLEREGRSLAIVFRDHALSDLIGFTYKSWDSKDAAADLLRRLREIRTALAERPETLPGEIPLVTIALDGENAWEYYPRDGRDFLQYLYEGLSSDPALRCVTVSEHLASTPPPRSLGWLHTGSWIGADLTTWIGAPAHNRAWALLHQARDLVAARRVAPGDLPDDSMEEAWHHILVCEGSDWFWWFGEHHHSELDDLWDLNFRRHLQEAYRLLGEPLPPELFAPLLPEGGGSEFQLPLSKISPIIDGRIGGSPMQGAATAGDEWANAGVLKPATLSTMQRAEGAVVGEIRFGWDDDNLYFLLVPSARGLSSGLEMEIHLQQDARDEQHAGNEQRPADEQHSEGSRQSEGAQPPMDARPSIDARPPIEVRPPDARGEAAGGPSLHGRSFAQAPVPELAPSVVGTQETAIVQVVLGDWSGMEEEGHIGVSCTQYPALAATSRSSWREVVEMALPLNMLPFASLQGLRLRISLGRGGKVEDLLPTRGALSLGSFRA